VIQKSLQAPTPILADSFPEISENFSTYISILMARDPENRFSTYEQAIMTLEGIRDGTQTLSRVPESVQENPTLLKKITQKLSALVHDSPTS